MSDLHSALKTTVLGTVGAGAAGLELALVRLQYGRNNEALTLHAYPAMLEMSGITRGEFLQMLGFEETSHCQFLAARECFASKIASSLDINALSGALADAYGAFSRADQHLGRCGISFGRRTPHVSEAVHGDGHNSPTHKVEKQTEDRYFKFVMTWIEGGNDNGWTTHYAPKHPPLSPEMASAFNFLNLRRFNECPEFDFGPCSWRFTEYSGDWMVGTSNFNVAHAWFDAHATDFSAGIEQLLRAQQAAQAMGLALWSSNNPQANAQSSGGSSSERPSTLIVGAGESSFDVAVSFAGPQRQIAEQLARRIQEAGYSVFYDKFYPEQLWGKELTVFFDDIYRKRARFCVMFISSEYVSRIWTNQERKSALARALQEKGNEYILPIEVENVEVPGLAPTIARLSLKEHTIDQIGNILIAKLRAEART